MVTTKSAVEEMTGIFKAGGALKEDGEIETAHKNTLIASINDSAGKLSAEQLYTLLKQGADKVTHKGRFTLAAPLLIEKNPKAVSELSPNQVQALLPAVEALLPKIKKTKEKPNPLYNTDQEPAQLAAPEKTTTQTPVLPSKDFEKNKAKAITKAKKEGARFKEGKFDLSDSDLTPLAQKELLKRDAETAAASASQAVDQPKSLGKKLVENFKDFLAFLRGEKGKDSKVRPEISNPRDFRHVISAPPSEQTSLSSAVENAPPETKTHPQDQKTRTPIAPKKLLPAPPSEGATPAAFQAELENVLRKRSPSSSSSITEVTDTSKDAASQVPAAPLSEVTQALETVGKGEKRNPALMSELQSKLKDQKGPSFH